MRIIKYRIFNIVWKEEDKLQSSNFPNEFIAYIGRHSAAGDELNEFFFNTCRALPEHYELEILDEFERYDR